MDLVRWVAGRSPWDAISVPPASVPCMLRGERCGTRRESRPGTYPVRAVFFRKAAASRAPSAASACCIFVWISGSCSEGGHAQAAVSVTALTSPLEREHAHLSTICQLLAVLCASEQQHGCGTMRGSCGTHNRCMAPGSRPHPRCIHRVVAVSPSRISPVLVCFA